MAGILSFCGKLAGGLNTSPRLLVDTFIMHCVVVEEKGVWSLVKMKSWLTGSILRHQPCICQYYGCKWCRCPCLGSTKDKYHRTMNLENQIRSLRRNAVSVWECENPEFSRKHLRPEFVSYPHYIVYDFETIFEKKNLHLTLDLTINCSHISISVAIIDSLTKSQFS